MGAERPAVALPHDPPVHIMASNGSSNPNHDARQGEAQVCAALVTGANRGIGLALTKELLHRGYTVHATHRRDIGGLATIDHEHLLTHAMDVRDPDAIHAVVNRVGPRLDLLINNAAVYDGRSRGLTDLDVPFLREAFDVNTLGPLQMVHASLGPLSTANGCVVMISTGMSSITDRPGAPMPSPTGSRRPA